MFADKKRVEKEIEKVIGEYEYEQGMKIVTQEQLEELELIPALWVENAGQSGTGLGTLYVLYLTDEQGNKTDEEIEEFVVKSNNY